MKAFECALSGATDATPTLKHSVEQARDEQDAKDLLVVTGQPKGQEDVEVGLAVSRVASGYCRKRARPPIERENDNLEEDETDKQGSQAQVTKVGGNRKSNDRTGK